MFKPDRDHSLEHHLRGLPPCGRAGCEAAPWLATQQDQAANPSKKVFIKPNVFIKILIKYSSPNQEQDRSVFIKPKNQGLAPFIDDPWASLKATENLPRVL